MSHSTRTVYLDHAAATPVDREVAARMGELQQRVYGNPSALYGLGREAERVLEEARQRVAKALEVASGEIIFTGSGTESDNVAVLGAARACRARGRHLVVSSIEHKAVLEAAAVLAQEGWEVTKLPVTKQGLVTVESVKAAVRPDTTFVSVMYANNEIGTVQPIAAIATYLNTLPAKERPLFHVDACQAAGSLVIAPRELGVDLLTLNGAKIYGPKGTGILYVREGVRLAPQIVGGSQEAGCRAGTENVPAIAGLAVAVQKAVAEQPVAAARLTELRNYFVNQLQQACPEIIRNGDYEQRLPNNVHITVPDLEGESLVLELDQYGVCCATGSACTAHDLTPSHVLRALGVPDELIHGSLRFTLGRSTTKDDLDYVVAAFEKAVTRLRTITAGSALRQIKTV